MNRFSIAVTIGLLVAGAALASGGYIDPESLALAPAVGMLGMMSVNVKASEYVALCAAVNPVSQGAGTVTTGWIAVKDFHRFLGVIVAGVLGAAATLDAKFQQATDGAGTGAKDCVPARAITQLVKATDDNKAALLDLKREDLDIKGGFTHIRLSMTVGAAASLIFGGVLGVGPVLAPAGDNDGALVKEIA